MSNAYAQSFLDGIKPDKKYTVAEWADNFRYLSNKSSAEPGKWRTDRVPYLKEIMECLSVTSPIREVIVQKGAQLGLTEAGNNWLGYIIDHAQAPTMCVLPTVDLAKRNSKQRLDPLIEDCPVLKNKIAKKRQGDSSNTLLEKDFVGGTLVLTGANSAVGLCSMPARFIFFDEIDRYPHDIGGEGSPIGLAEARSRTFAKKKFFKISTPTNDGYSQINEHFEKTDKRKCFVPCPECGHMQVLVFGQLRWENDDPLTTKYHCIECDYGISNYEKTKMLLGHEWRATAQDNSNGKIAGFHISSLYSPVGWWSWEDIVDDWLKAQGSDLKLKVFTNTTLGETWKEKVQVPDYERLYERRVSYQKNLIPKEVLFLTAGVDIQADRIELEIVGWCRNKVSYSIDYRVLLGDTKTSDMQVFSDLEKVIDETFPMEKNKNLRMGIKKIAIDTGYNTQEIYDFCRRFSPTRVLPIKGNERLNVMYSLPKGVDVRQSPKGGKVLTRGVKLWQLGVNVIKSQLYSWLMQSNVEEVVPYGFCFFPEYDLEFFKMLTAESLVIEYDKNGYRKEYWKLDRKRNESLDCRVYARGAAAIEGIDRFNEDTWTMLENDPFRPTINSVNQPKKKNNNNREGWL